MAGLTPFIRFGILAAALYVGSSVLPGLEIENLPSLVLMAVVLTAVGAVVGPILVMFTLPLTVLTFGLFLLVLNALLFWFSSLLVPGVRVDSFLSALLASLIVTLFRFVGRWKKV